MRETTERTIRRLRDDWHDRISTIHVSCTLILLSTSSSLFFSFAVTLKRKQYFERWWPLSKASFIFLQHFLRAPEVAQQRSYTEKVDVYSFGVLIWQMASSKKPFKGYSREDLMTKVVSGAERPKTIKRLPRQFNALLKSCWQVDARRRPSFSEIVTTLEGFLVAHGNETARLMPKLPVFKIFSSNILPRFTKPCESHECALQAEKRSCDCSTDGSD